MKFLIYTLLLAIPTRLLAQEEDAVYIKKSVNVEIDISGTSLQIEEKVYNEKMFFRNFEKHSRESIHFSELEYVDNLEAKTLVPKNSKFKAIKVEGFETKDILNGGVFYGGQKSIDFVYPGLVAGAITKLSYSNHVSDPHLLSMFYFNDDCQVDTSEYSITFPAAVKVKFKLFNCPQVEFKEEIVKDKITYKWRMYNVHKYQYEAKAPGQLYNIPHIIVFIDSYEAKGKTVKVSGNVEDLYAHHYSLYKKTPAAKTDSLVTIVKTITKGLTSNLDKSKAIFQWVQSNIKYIAFENGMGGFIPRSAADVCSKRYGDCKDMGNLLKAMHNIDGQEAYITWIGTRDRPYTYAEVPTEMCDNHVICTIRSNGDYLFLDATNSYTKFGMPSSMIQGKEALIGIDENNFKVMQIPVIPYQENQQTDSILVSIEKETLKGEYFSTLSGYKKDDLEYLKLKAELRNDQDYLVDFLNLGANNLIINQPKFGGLGNRNEMGKISFKFTLNNYFKNISGKIYINLNLNKNLPGEKLLTEKRKLAWEQDYKFENISTTILEIPDGYMVSDLPQNTDKKWNEYGISTTYILRGSEVILTKTFYSNFLLLNPDKFLEWNQFLDAYSKTNQQILTLIKK